MAASETTVTVHVTGLEGLLEKLDLVLVELKRLNKSQEGEAMDLKGIQDKVDALKAQVEAETAVDQSIVTLVTGLVSTVADLKKQLADAIAAGDPAALQAVADALDGVGSTLAANVQSISDAVVANTPSA